MNKSADSTLASSALWQGRRSLLGRTLLVSLIAHGSFVIVGGLVGPASPLVSPELAEPLQEARSFVTISEIGWHPPTPVELGEQEEAPEPQELVASAEEAPVAEAPVAEAPVAEAPVAEAPVPNTVERRRSPRAPAQDPVQPEEIAASPAMAQEESDALAAAEPSAVEPVRQVEAFEPVVSKDGGVGPTLVAEVVGVPGADQVGETTVGVGSLSEGAVGTATGGARVDGSRATRGSRPGDRSGAGSGARGQTRAAQLLPGVNRRAPYPEAARRRRVESDCELLMVLSESGHIERVDRVVCSEEGWGFEEAIREHALRNFQFAPAVEDGLQTTASIRWTHHFRISS